MAEGDVATDTTVADTAPEPVPLPVPRPSGGIVGPGETITGAEVVGGPSFSLTDVFPTPSQVQGAMTAGTQAWEERQKAGAALDARRTREMKDLEAQQKAYFNAEAASAKRLPPDWNSDLEREKRIRGPFESFGSAGVIFANIAAGFSRQPAIAALNASAAAMNAMYQHDVEGYESAHQAWKDNTQLAIKRFDMQHQLFTDAQHLFNTNQAAWKAETIANLARFDDKVGLALMQAGQFPELFKSVESQAKAIDTMRESLDKDRLWEARRKEYQTQVQQFEADHGPDSRDPYTPDIRYAARRAIAEMGANDVSSEKYIAAKKTFDIINGENRIPTVEEVISAVQQAKAHVYSGTGGRPLTLNQVEAASVATRSKQLQSEGLSEAEAYTQALRENDERKARAKQGATALTEDAIDAAARTMRKTGRLPQGTGRFSPAERTAIFNRYADILKDENISPEEAAEQQRHFQTQMAGMQSAERFYTSGKGSQQLDAYNTAVSHLELFRELGRALANKDTQRINQMRQRWNQEFGSEIPTNFDVAKQFISNETVTAVVNTGGGVTDRQEAQQAWTRVAAPRQIMGAIDTVERLMVGRLKSQKQHYVTATLRPEEDFFAKLTDEGQAVYDKWKGSTSDKGSSKDGIRLDWNQ